MSINASLNEVSFDEKKPTVIPSYGIPLDVVQIFRQAERIVVFTGAGMSADSGIETFRGSRGAWSGFLGYISLIYGGTPLGWYLTPGYVWSRFVSEFYQPIANATPHEGYFALTRILDKIYRENASVITMNVDGFHQESGFNKNRVYEIHGTVRKFICGKCGLNMDAEVQVPTLTPVRCISCNKGYARPAVTLFTESLPADQWMKSLSVVQSLQPYDIMLIIGTSSVVYPAADLPKMAKDRGAKLVEINPTDNTPLSSICDAHIKLGAAEALSALEILLNQS
jgi:NAD-dependent deacetylase